MLLVNGKRREDLPKMAKAVTFNLVNKFTYSDKRLKQPSGKDYVRKNQRAGFPTVYSRYDRASNQTIEYRYAVREIPIATGKDAGSVKYSPDRVVFTECRLVVTPDKPDLYEFLMNCPWLEVEGNEKVFSGSYKPHFYVVDPIADAKGRIDRIVLREKAISMITRDLSDEQLNAILKTIPGESEVDEIDVVRGILIDYAEKNTKDFMAKIKMMDKTIKVDEGTEEKFNRDELIAKAKKLSISQGVHNMADAKLVIKIDNEIKSLKKELENPDIKSELKTAIEQRLESVGELVKV